MESFRVKSSLNMEKNDFLLGTNQKRNCGPYKGPEGVFDN